MRPKEPRDSGQKDLFRARLEQIIDMGHPLAKLVRLVDWVFLETRFGAADTDKPGHPPQRQNQRGPNVYSLHAPEVECIGKGKARHRSDQTRPMPPLRRRALHRRSQIGAPHGPQPSRRCRR
jgi:hypothetical protein